jgi:hypothetical protein
MFRDGAIRASLDSCKSMLVNGFVRMLGLASARTERLALWAVADRF